MQKRSSHRVASVLWGVVCDLIGLLRTVMDETYFKQQSEEQQGKVTDVWMCHAEIQKQKCKIHSLFFTRCSISIILFFLILLLFLTFWCFKKHPQCKGFCQTDGTLCISPSCPLWTHQFSVHSLFFSSVRTTTCKQLPTAGLMGSISPVLSVGQIQTVAGAGFGKLQLFAKPRWLDELKTRIEKKET